MASSYALPSNGVRKHSRGHQPTQTSPASTAQAPAEDYDHFHSHETFTNGYAALHSHEAPAKGRPRGKSDLGRSLSTAAITTQPAPASRTVEILTGSLVCVHFLCASWAHSSTYHMPTLQDELDEIPSDVEIGSTFSPTLFASLLGSSILLLCGLYGRSLSEMPVKEPRRNSSTASNGDRESLDLAQHGLQMLRHALGFILPIYASLQLGGLRVGTIVLASFATGLLSPTSTMTPLKVRMQRHKELLLAFLLAMICDFSGLTTTIDWHLLILGYLALVVCLLSLKTPLVDTPTSRSIATAKRKPGVGSVTVLPSFVATRSSCDRAIIAGGALLVSSLVASFILRTNIEIGASTIVFSVCSVMAAATLVFIANPVLLHSRTQLGALAGWSLSLALSAAFDMEYWSTVLVDLSLTVLTYVGARWSALPAPSPLSAPSHEPVHTGHHHKHGGVSFLTNFLLARVPAGSLVYDILSEKDSRRIAYFTCLNFGFMIVQGFYGWVSGSLGLLSDTVHMFFDCLALMIGLAASVASKWPTSADKPYGWGKLNTLAGFGNGIFLMLVSVEFVWSAIEGIMDGNELKRVEELLIVSTMGLVVNMVGLLAFGHAHAGHDHGHGHGHGHTSHSHGSHSHSHVHAHTHDHHHHHDHEHEHGQEPDAQHHPSHEHVHGSHNHGHRQGSESSHRHANSGNTDGNDDHHHHGAREVRNVPRDSHATTATSTHTNGSLYPPPDGTHVHNHHGHENENMHGIYLHIAADAGGSLAVIISTTLTLWKPWYGWDPLATIIIAILIFMAAVPLVQQSARKLLLVIPEKLEYELKNALHELVALRGVVGFSAPRFWVDDKDGEGGHEGHHHHGHSHGHDDGCDGAKLQGAIHVTAARAASVEDVRSRVEQFFAEKHMDIVVQVEKEGDPRCWCGGGTAEKQF